MLADELDYVIGVDPHRDVHALAVVEVRSGVVVFEASVAANSGGYASAVSLADRYAPGRRAFAVEGTGSFGAGLTRVLAAHGERALEVGATAARAPLGRQERRARRDPRRAQRARSDQASAAACPVGSGRRYGR